MRCVSIYFKKSFDIIKIEDTAFFAAAFDIVYFGLISFFK